MIDISLTEIESNPVPPGATTFALPSGQGVELRVAVWTDPGARGTVVVYPGRTEPIELHFPTVAFLRSLGWAVVVVDWRGQGRSTRPLADRNKCHVTSFEAYQQDARALLTAPEMVALPRPRALFCNSMGGAIAVRQIANPGWVADGVVLCAPLLGLRFGKFENAFVRSTARAMNALGRGQNYAAVRGARTVLSMGFRNNVLTSSRERFTVLEELEARASDLAVGAPSWAWVQACIREFVALHELPAPKCPVLMVISAKDRVVSLEAAARFARQRQASVRFILLNEGRHSLLLERDEIRQPVLDQFAVFLNQIG